MKILKRPELSNATDLGDRNPETFSIPSTEQLSNIKVNDVVFVCANRERFKATVIELYSESKFICEISSQLILTHTHGLKLNDIILVKSENIYSVIKH